MLQKQFIASLSSYMKTYLTDTGRQWLQLDLRLNVFRQSAIPQKQLIANSSSRMKTCDRHRYVVFYQQKGRGIGFSLCGCVSRGQQKVFQIMFLKIILILVIFINSVIFLVFVCLFISDQRGLENDY